MPGPDLTIFLYPAQAFKASEPRICFFLILLQILSQQEDEVDPSNCQKRAHLIENTALGECKDA